ncbi:PREDICTED: uncharacterized protein LOC109232677 [Nicotiana attenuata]|uniref:uncharacterized protein LOC109232677 n=1 Tax=Nicotiana attenuata TaxID=49451 RepID=UPI0009059E6D|nr:PREDICTED: uncharacterized protein LOC109232677 [Nicotiana attenuata]
MVRLRGRGDTSKGRGEPSWGRGKSALSLGQQKTIRKKASTDRGRGADLSETSSYIPSREVSEGNSSSVQEQSAIQSRPQGRYQLKNGPPSSHTTFEGSESSNQVSEPSATPLPEAQVFASVHDNPDDGRGGDATAPGLERSRKKEVGRTSLSAWMPSPASVEPRDYDTKVRPNKTSTWYSLIDASDPKKKVQPPTTIGQSDEPAVVAPETVDVLSISAEPFSSAAAMPPLSSTATTTTPRVAQKPIPTAPLFALGVSQILASLKNWMQTATVKLSDLTNTVAA